jgi:hypothetical protein
MTRICTACPAIEKPICDEFVPEPSEMVARGRVVYSRYCETCGHEQDCHEDLTDEQVQELNIPL